MNDTHIEDSDDESDFYKILATWEQDEVKDMLSEIKKDTFDGSQGPQVGLTSDGHVAMLLVMTPATAKMVLDAWTEYTDHDCEPARVALMGYLLHQAMLLGMVLPALGDDVQDMDFFTHTDGQEPDDIEWLQDGT